MASDSATQNANGSGRGPDKVRTFEDLAVFQMARKLAKEIYQLTRDGSMTGDRGLCDQIRRAAVSVVSNIAEGFERGGNVELIQFLFIAKGSCGEVRAQLLIALDQGYLEERTHRALNENCKRLSAGFANFIGYLRGSKFQGAKHHVERQRSDFEKMLDGFVPPPFPTPPSAS